MQPTNLQYPNNNITLQLSHNLDIQLKIQLHMNLQTTRHRLDFLLGQAGWLRLRGGLLSWRRCCCGVARAR